MLPPAEGRLVHLRKGLPATIAVTGSGQHIGAMNVPQQSESLSLAISLPCISCLPISIYLRLSRSDSPCLLCRVGARDELLVSLAASTMARVDEVCLATRACSYIHLAPTDGLPSG